MEIKYKMVQKEVQALAPLDVLLVEEMVAGQVEAKRKKMREEEKLHVLNEKAHEKKLEELFKAQSSEIMKPPNESMKKLKASSKLEEHS